MSNVIDLDLNPDPELADRLRRTFRAVAEQTPTDGHLAAAGPVVLATLSPPEPAGRFARRRLPIGLSVAAAAAAVAVLVVGAIRDDGSTTRVTTPATAGQDPAWSPTPANPDSPPTTFLAPSGLVLTAWDGLVADVLAAPAWAGQPSDGHWATTTGAPGPRMFTAAIGAPMANPPVAFIGVRAFAEGEYRSDPAWLQETARSTSAGQPIDGGVLFLDDGAFRSATIVTPRAVVTVRSDAPSQAGVPPLAAFEAAARTIVAGLPEILAGGS